MNKTKEFINEEILFKDNKNQRRCDELKYNVIEDENIDNDDFRGNEQILINNGNFIKNIKDKEYNDDINYEDIKKHL